jgi:hypothetical protein
MAGDASRKNGQKGGRPAGAKSKATIEREAVLRAYRERVCKVADRLLDAELTVAQGCSYLYRKPKSAEKGEPRKAEKVTDEATIAKFLSGELDDDAHDWYFITTERPDTMTIRGMFDRVWDRPPQRTEVTGKDGADLEAPHTIINNYAAPAPAVDAPAR